MIINHEQELYMFIVERHVCYRWLARLIDSDNAKSILTQTV